MIKVNHEGVAHGCRRWGWGPICKPRFWQQSELGETSSYLIAPKCGDELALHSGVGTFGRNVQLHPDSDTCGAR